MKTILGMKDGTDKLPFKLKAARYLDGVWKTKVYRSAKSLYRAQHDALSPSVLRSGTSGMSVKEK